VLTARKQGGKTRLRGETELLIQLCTCGRKGCSGDRRLDYSGVRQRGSLARAAAAWALVRYAGLSQRSASAVLGMSTGAAVSHQIAKWQKAIGKEQSWARTQRRAGPEAAEWLNTNSRADPAEADARAS
jgi:hypothetical protein